jgi:hypothetical protein
MLYLALKEDILRVSLRFAFDHEAPTAMGAATEGTKHFVR